MIVEMDITGLDGILQNLMRLNIDEAIENRALNKAGNVTKEAIKREANFGKRSRGEGNTGSHSRGIYKKNIKVKRPKDGEVIIHSGGAYHAHLIEFGRSAGSIMAVKKGKLQKITWGKTNPNPVFSRGFEQSKIDAQDAMIDELVRGLGL